MNHFAWTIFSAALMISLTEGEGSNKQPHIVYILADDLGWNDVGFHNKHVYTPHLDSMAEEGLELTQSYVLPLCSPSRHAFLTGRYPFRDGAQHMMMNDEQPRCLPLDLKLLPEKLKELGYRTHLIGKWHLGYCHVDCTPRRRGFDTFYGLYGGHIDHFRHDRDGLFDLRDNDDVVSDKQGISTTHLFTERAEQIIRQHDVNTPLFLYLSHAMTHSPVQAVDHYIQRYEYIQDPVRRTYLAMVTMIDESVGNISRALKEKGMDDNAIIVFQSDNGAQPLFGGNNYPLRGSKLTLWEGGTRSVTVVSGGQLGKRKGKEDSLFHVSDWYPTFLRAAGGAIDSYKGDHIDGIDQLDMILTGGSGSRREFVYNLDIHLDRFLPLSGYGAYRYGNYKLLVGYSGAGTSGWPSPWIRPSEICGDEDILENTQCQFKGSIFGLIQEEIDQHQRHKMRNVIERAEREAQILRLYDIKTDPSEETDLSNTLPELASALLVRLQRYMDQVALPVMPDPVKDPKSRSKDGFHGPGWCSREQVVLDRRRSLSAIKRNDLTKDACEATAVSYDKP